MIKIKLFSIFFSMPFLFAMCTTAQADTVAAGFGVTVKLLSFSDTATADQRCTHGSPATRGSTLRISCPAAVDVQAIARVSASKTGQMQRINADPGQLVVSADKLIHSSRPVDITISW